MTHTDGTSILFEDDRLTVDMLDVEQLRQAVAYCVCRLSEYGIPIADIQYGLREDLEAMGVTSKALLGIMNPSPTA